MSLTSALGAAELSLCFTTCKTLFPSFSHNVSSEGGDQWSKGIILSKPTVRMQSVLCTGVCGGVQNIPERNSDLLTSSGAQSVRRSVTQDTRDSWVAQA